MSGETLLEVLTGDIPLTAGKCYTWSGRCEKFSGTIVWVNEVIKLIDINEENFTVFDFKDRKRYTWNMENIRENCTKINPVEVPHPATEIKDDV